MTRITQQQLEAYLWGAATRLRGTIDAGDYKQFIFPILFFKRLSDVYDEEVVAAMEAFDGDEEEALRPENHRFQIPEGAHWSDVRESSKDMGRAIQKAMRDIEAANPDKLAGIFGDAQWTNKDRLSDAMLRDLVEHFSSLELKIANLPEDELGNGYEYLIKKFADDSGHTAAEFYTNRTVVHLMTEMLQPQPGESIYDPTCGSGGMLLSAVAHLKNQGKEWRNVKLYGQERNLMTSSIARMNCFLHGIEEFDIERGDTLGDPKFVKGDKLQKFDVVFANPPYSIKQWDREAFATDKWGRNKYGTPPQGRADYAFWQHILASMDPKTGRCAILFPHGVLFRKEEEEMRRQLIEADLIECVVGLGGNLFYNSAMEACVVVCRTSKPKNRKGKVLLIEASGLVTHEKAWSRLTDEQIARISGAYGEFRNQEGLARLVPQEEALRNDGNLNIPLYLARSSSAIANDGAGENSLGDDFVEFCGSMAEARKAVSSLTRERYTAIPHSVGKLRVPRENQTNWPKATLGDVAIRDTSKVEPRGSSVERWVGADQIDEGDLRIRRWGLTDDPLFPPTFRFSFRAGHVLVHSRNPRKVAIPNFGGITGEKLFVLKSKNESKLRTEFLALVLSSSMFHGWSDKWMSGSVNKFLNWSALEKFQFSLPPAAVQDRIIEIMRAAEQTVAGARAALEAATDLGSSYGLHLDQVALTPGGRTVRRLADVADVVDCKHITPPSISSGVPMVGPGDISEGPLVFDDCKRISREDAAYMMDHCKVRRWDMVMGRDQSIGKVAYVASDEAFVFGQGTVLIQGAEASSRFLFQVLRSPSVQGQLRRAAKGSTFKRLNVKAIRDLEIPWPESTERKAAEEFAEKHEVLLLAVKSHVGQANLFKSRLLTSILGGE